MTGSDNLNSGKRFFNILLVSGVKRRNLGAYLIVALLSSAFAGLLGMLEPSVLNQMKIPQIEQGTVTGNLRALQEFIYITVLGFYGVMADRYGRKPIYVLGMVLTAVGYAVYPHAGSVSELALFRLLIAFGGAATIGMMVTVIADYTEDESRGRANGLQGFMLVLGALIPPVLGFMPKILADGGMPQAEALSNTFLIASSLGLLGAVIAFFGLASNVGKPAQRSEESIIVQMREGLKAARDPGVALSYGAAFISRGDLAVTGAFMGLWLMQFGMSHGMSMSDSMSQMATRVLITVVGGMFGALLMGFFSDKIRRATAVTFASGLAAVVYLAIFFVEDPTATWVMGLLFIMGIAELSAFVSSQALVGQQAPKARRGAVIGFFSVAGAIGILVGSLGGGQLFRHIGPSAPFVLFGFLNAIVFVWSLLVKDKIVTPQN
jgi:MFS family permease